MKKESMKESMKETMKETTNETTKEIIPGVLKILSGPEKHLVEERLKKLENLKSKGINPFPYKYDVTDYADSIKKKFDSIKAEEHTGKNVSVAGRIMLFRDMGKVAFLTLKDSTGQIQLYLRKNDLGADYDLVSFLDIGDFVGAKGEVFKTMKGELSIYVKSFVFLSKSLRPMPDKFHGLKDTELRYRKRHLDLIMNSETADVFIKRIRIIKAIREFLDERGFLEVETPTLQPVYGGAAAKPFTTMHNELKMKLFLKISDELYLKRLIIGGFSKVYEIDKDFRNEGIDTTHNPEFTMLEAYWAYADYHDMMKLTEDMYEFVAKKVLGTTKSKFKGVEIDFKAPWKKITMLDAIKKYVGIDAGKMSEKELAKFVNDEKIPFDKKPSWGNYVNAIFEEKCEDKFIQPTFVIDHPRESTPLCKVHREDERLIERFEPFCCGMELANAYSELNDPIVQRKLLEEQAKLLRSGDEEANPLDEDFIEAMEQGMPPTGGLGVGIDRMVMLLLGQESIRDVLFFPTMKPEKLEDKN